MENGKSVQGMEFAGGFEYPVPTGTVRSSNITPDEETGIGLWTKEMFIEAFKLYRPESAKRIDPDSIGYQTVMPWTLYGGLTDRDLSAMYDYLRTLPAVKNEVEKFTKSAK
jgi:hypothetical protein